MSKYISVDGGNIDEDDFCEICAKTKAGIELVIAQIDMSSGHVVIIDPDAKTDAYAQEVIRHISDLAKEAHSYSIRRLEQLLENVANDICRSFPHKEAKQKLADLGFKEEEMSRFVTLPFQEEYEFNH